MRNLFNLGDGLMIKNKTIRIDFSTARWVDAHEKAQYMLDSIAFTDTVPYMPMITGSFFKVTQKESQTLAGTGWVCAGKGPQARFLYEGKVMIDPLTGSAWAKQGHRKVVTNRNLTYTGSRYGAKVGKKWYRGAHPLATDHWFEVAKKNHGKDWVKTVKDAIGGR